MMDCHNNPKCKARLETYPPQLIQPVTSWDAFELIRLPWCIGRHALVDNWWVTQLVIDLSYEFRYPDVTIEIFMHPCTADELHAEAQSACRRINSEASKTMTASFGRQQIIETWCRYRCQNNFWGWNITSRPNAIGTLSAAFWWSTKRASVSGLTRCLTYYAFPLHTDLLSTFQHFDNCGQHIFLAKHIVRLSLQRTHMPEILRDSNMRLEHVPSNRLCTLALRQWLFSFNIFQTAVTNL